MKNISFKTCYCCCKPIKQNDKALCLINKKRYIHEDCADKFYSNTFVVKVSTM